MTVKINQYVHYICNYGTAREHGNQIQEAIDKMADKDMTPVVVAHAMEVGSPPCEKALGYRETIIVFRDAL